MGVHAFRPKACRVMLYYKYREPGVTLVMHACTPIT